MRLLVIDLETTSLDPAHGNILEIAAKVVNVPNVEDDTGPKITDTFHTLVCDQVLQGDHVALAMNAELLRSIAVSSQALPDSYGAAECFAHWIDNRRNTGVTFDKQLIPAGKQVAAFDIAYLKHFGFAPKHLSHRAVDIGDLFLQWDDNGPPSMSECVKRAGLDQVVTHRAMEDVDLSIKLLDYGLRRVMSA